MRQPYGPVIGYPYTFSIRSVGLHHVPDRYQLVVTYKYIAPLQLNVPAMLHVFWNVRSYFGVRNSNEILTLDAYNTDAQVGIAYEVRKRDIQETQNSQR